MGEGAACPQVTVMTPGIYKVEAPGIQLTGSVMRVFTHQICLEAQGASSGGDEGLVVTGMLPQLASPTW